jgi:hypothetical protein
MKPKNKFWELIGMDFQAAIDPSIIDFSDLRFKNDTSLHHFERWYFTGGLRYDMEGEIRTRLDLASLAFNLFEYAGVIADGVFAQIFEKYANDDVQLHPIRNTNSGKKFFYINITKRLDCIDFHSSKIDRNPITGKPFAAREIVIDERRVGSAQIFRMTHFTAKTILSVGLRERLLEAGPIRGSHFMPLKSG